jgi:hypothetical protein
VNYLDEVLVDHRQRLNDLLTNALSFAIVADEAIHSQGRFALHILFFPQLNSNASMDSYLAAVKFLDSANAAIVSQVILACLAA